MLWSSTPVTEANVATFPAKDDDDDVIFVWIDELKVINLNSNLTELVIQIQI